MLRNRDRTRAAGSGLGLVLFLIAAGSCVDEKIVYRDGPNFQAPPAAAANFLGYSDEAARKTVCGSCHVTQQGRWVATAHAGAFETLEKSGRMQGLCQACHTVNDKGNTVTDTTAGWRSTHDDRYHDVQCESCHGPGLPHVTAPARGQMLASIRMDTLALATKSCGECHTGTHHPFAEEWAKTRHASSARRAYSGGTLNTGCQSCHVGQTVLNAWGVNTNYVEKTQTASLATAEGVTCVVCHDPHGSEHPKQLRYAVDSRDPATNLCVRCHDRRGNPDFTGNRDSPHAPHGPLVFGTAGWWPPGVEFEETESSHSSEKNPKLCAGCHVQNYTVTDKATGAFQVQVVGHRFLAIPCVDANGAPTADQNCQISARSYKSCAASGCHTEATARTAYASAESDIALLAGLLKGMLAQVPAAEKLPAAAGKVTTARGAAYNVALAESHGAAAHNPFLVRALLRASIVQVSIAYNIPRPPGLNLAPYDRIITTTGTP